MLQPLAVLEHRATSAEPKRKGAAIRANDSPPNSCGLAARAAAKARQADLIFCHLVDSQDVLASARLILAAV